MQLLPTKTIKQGKVPESVFLKDTTDWCEYVLNRDHIDHNHNALLGHSPT